METQKPPIFEYDDRYFLESKYTRKELFTLQEQILQLSKKTNDYANVARNEIKDFDRKEIDMIITILIEHQYHKDL